MEKSKALEYNKMGVGGENGIFGGIFGGIARYGLCLIALFTPHYVDSSIPAAASSCNTENLIF